MYKYSYQLVMKKDRINQDLRRHRKSIERAVLKILPKIKHKIIIDKEKYTFFTKYEISRWKKICIGLEIAQIPNFRRLRKVKRDEYGKITSSRLFCRVKEKKL